MNYPQHLLGLKQLTAEQIEGILSLANEYRKFVDEKRTLTEKMKGMNAVNLFFEDSTRTRVSFELAENMLGINAINFSNTGSSFSKGESLTDTVRNLNAMRFDFYIVRHSVPGIPKLISEIVDGHVINAGDGAGEHPTQGLLDILTLKRHFGKLSGRRVCIVGDISHSRVALSNIVALNKLGAVVSVCGPSTFIPRGIEGLEVNVYEDIDKAIREHDALNLLRVQLERNAGSSIPSLTEYHKFYGVTKERLKQNPGILILHPGPMNIGVELDHEVSMSKNSRIFDQVTNGLAVRLSVLDLLSGRER